MVTGLSLRGMNTQSVAIQMLNVTQDTTLLTMNDQTRVEDLTLNLTSSTSNLTGILYPNNTSITSKLRTAVVNVTSTNSNSNALTYGIYANGSNVNPLANISSNAIRGSTINVAGNTGTIRGIMVTGPTQFYIRDTNVYANGPTGSTNTIGVESSNTGSFSILKTSSIYGTSADLRQATGYTGYTGSTIQLSATDLVTANSGNNGFSVNTEPNQLYMVISGGQGTLGDISVGKWFLNPGNINANQLLGGNPPSYGISIPVSQKTIFFQAVLSISGLISDISGGTAYIYIYKTTAHDSLSTGTPLVSLGPINATNTGPYSSSNFGITINPNINPPEHLQVQLVITGSKLSLGRTAIFLSLGTY